jgi:hypothetical protein
MSKETNEFDYERNVSYNLSSGIHTPNNEEHDILNVHERSEAWDRFVTKRPRIRNHNESHDGLKSERNAVYMKPATFDGSDSWTDYKAHSHACAEINK